MMITNLTIDILSTGNISQSKWWNHFDVSRKFMYSRKQQPKQRWRDGQRTFYESEIRWRLLYYMQWISIFWRWKSKWISRRTVEQSIAVARQNCQERNRDSITEARWKKFIWYSIVSSEKGMLRFIISTKFSIEIM